jgi:F-type H+-transporting ATPase subunit epsilon
MQIEIITPETMIFSGEAHAVQLPGVDGLFQILNEHAPIISILKDGIIKIDLPNDFSADNQKNELIKHLMDAKEPKIIRIPIKGGVTEFVDNKLIILAD